MIKKRGNKFVVTDKSGTKVLGTHPSKEKAAKQLAAIEISKAKHMQHENKSFKAFRSTLNESEYSEVLTGYGNRSAHKDGAGLHHIHSAGALNGVNAMLSTISRATYLDPNEALLKMKVRLNVVQLDFDWRPGMLLQGVGSYDITVKQFGRVDGYDALTGQIRFDGKANPTGGYTELNLHIDVELNPDSLYVVSAKLAPATPVVAEEVEQVDEDKKMGVYSHDSEEDKKAEKKKSKSEKPSMYEETEQLDEVSPPDMEKMTGSKKTKASFTKQYGKRGKSVMYATAWKLHNKKMQKEETELDEAKKKLTKDQLATIRPGMGKPATKPVKEEAELDEMAQTPARQRDMEHKIQRHEAQAQKGYEAKMTKTGKAAARGRKLEAKHDAASRRVIKQDTKEYESEKLYGRGGKIVKSKSKPVKEGVEAIEEMHKPGDTVKVPHKGKMVKGKIVRHDSGGSSKAAQHGGGYVVDVGEYGSITVPHHKIVKEGAEQIDELSKATKDAYVAKRGSQLQRMTSGLDRYRNLLTGKQQANAVKGIKRATGVQEELVGGQKKLDVNKNKKLDAQDFKLLRAKKTVKEETVEEGKKFKAWTPRLDKLMANRDAVRSKPKKSILTQKVEGGKKIGAARPIAAVKEEAAAKAKKPAPKADPHAGARTEIGKQKSIKRMLDKHGMRW